MLLCSLFTEVSVHYRFTIIFTHLILVPSYILFLQTQCRLSCSRFSFCWLVLIGLKWVTSSITEGFKPSLNVSISWGSGGIVIPPLSPLAALLIGGRNSRPDRGLASGKIRRIMSALITMYTKTTGSVGAQTEQLSQIGWARGFSASTLTLISLCAPRLPTLRLKPLGYQLEISKLITMQGLFLLTKISVWMCGVSF